MSNVVGTRKQIAEALETGEDSVRWLKEHAGLPFVYVNRKEWVVPWAALHDWLATEVAKNALACLHEKAS
jgi:hypothetical protein